MIKLNELNQKIKENKWLIAAILFFIVWKFFLIGLLWEGRAIPPEPDDSYNYLTQIASVAECTTNDCSSTNITLKNSSGFNYLTYRVFFGILGKIFHFSVQEIYHLSFYFGIIFLALILTPFLKSFSQNKNLLTWSIFFLSFYHGFGETHGFFWVVPSFFFVIFFFLLILFLLRDDIKLPFWGLFILTFSYTFLHPMSVFSILILPFYLLFFSFFTWTFPRVAWKKVFLIVILVISFSLTAHQILPNNAPTQKAYSLDHAVQEVKSIVNVDSPISFSPSAPKPSSSATPFLPSLFYTMALGKIETLHHAYFRWILPHWFFIFPLLGTLLILVYKKNIKLISLYFASLFFFIIATFLNQFGYRSAIILWPITYLSFSFSSWYLLEILHKAPSWWSQKFLFWSLCFLVGCFLLLNVLFAVIFNENFSARHNYKIEPALVEYLLEMPANKTIMASRELLIAEMYNYPKLRERMVSYNPEADILIITDSEHIPKKEPSLLLRTIQKTLNKDKLEVTPSTTQLAIPSGYERDRQFGMFIIYKKLP